MCNKNHLRSWQSWMATRPPKREGDGIRALKRGRVR